MIFHSFKNQNERRTFGGSAFIEIQYCTQKSGTELKKIVNTSRHWIDNSLYIYFDDIDSFFANYKKIFYEGTYQNLHSGEVDIFGINYYSSEQLKNILLKIEEQKPLDYMVIVEWLKNGENFNGFYILGI